LGGRQDAATRTGISQFNQQFAREGEQYDTTQTQYQDALELEAEQYATGREDISTALGLEADRWGLGREMNPESTYAGMTSSQQLEHQRLTKAALRAAGVDAKPGSMIEQVASVAMLEGWAPGEVNKLMGEIDGYLEDTFRGEDLSDENVLAALMSLERTDIIMSVLGMMDQEQRNDLVDTMGSGGGTASGTGTSQMGAPTSGSGDLGPAETAGALSSQDAFDANVMEVATSTGKGFDAVYADLYGKADKDVRRNLREPDEGFQYGWFEGSDNINIGGVEYPSEAWAAMTSTWGKGGPMTGGTLSEEERATAWLENKLETHYWDMGPRGMQWKLR